MSDHDPNGNDDFRNKRVNFGQPKYDLSATQPMRKNTMMYSMVDAEEAKRRHGGSSQVSGTAPTEEMPALEELHITTVKMIVSQIIENDIRAWTSLPASMKDLLLAQPELFTLVPDVTYSNDIPCLHYEGIEMKWNGQDSWLVVGIKRS